MKSLVGRDKLSKSCIRKLDNASIPKPGNLSIVRVHILVSTKPHSKDSNHLQANHIIKFKGSNKLCHWDSRILGKIRDGKQTRLLLKDMEEQIGEIL